MTNYLHEKTALLPQIKIREVDSAIGKSMAGTRLAGREFARVPPSDGGSRRLVILSCEEKSVYRAPLKDLIASFVEAGGRIYVFEHNPRNPLVPYVIARTPIDRNAILLDASEVRHGLLDAARYELDTDYLMFMPPGLTFLRGVDRLLAWLPMGAQYAITARKAA